MAIKLLKVKSDADPQLSKVDAGDAIATALTWSATQTYDGSSTIDISSGTLTTSAAQKRAIVEGVAGNVDIGNYDFQAQTLSADSLTATRVVFAGVDGVLSDDSDFTFSTDTLTVTKIGAFEAAGAINFASQAMTSVDINSGTIDGATIATSNITVGSGKTLDVSSGTLTLAANQISGDKVEGGTIAAITISALTTAEINASTDIDIGTHDLRAATLTADTLSAGQVVYTGSNGLLSAESGFEYNASSDTLTVANLTVSGTTTTVNSTVVTIADPIFEIGSDASDDNKDRGIKMKYHTGSAAKVAFMGFDDSTSKFLMIADATDTSQVITGSAATLVANLNGNADTVTNGVYTTSKISALAATSSSELAGVISDETGSGALVFGTSPTLVTPALGTPASGVLTNCTALPAAQVAQGTMASGMVLVAPALGTPASGVLTNCTGTAASLTAGTATVATTVTLTDEGSDTTCFPVFAQTATGNIAMETDASALTYNAGTGSLAATTFVGALTGNASGTAATVTGGTQSAITTCSNLVTVGTIGSGTWQGTAIARGYIAADAIDGTKLADDAVDSEHLADGSIDAAHIASSAVTAAKFNSDVVKSSAGLELASAGDSAFTAVMSEAATASGMQSIYIGDTTETFYKSGYGPTGNGLFTVTAYSDSGFSSEASDSTSTTYFKLVFLSSGGPSAAELIDAQSYLSGSWGGNQRTWDSATSVTPPTGGLDITDGGVTFAKMAAAAVITASETVAGNDSDSAFPTSAAVIDYVAAQITAEDLDITSDSGTIDIDLNSETLTIAGGTGLDSSASSTTVTLAIDSTVATLTGSQTLTNKTLTSPDINGGSLDSAVIGGTTAAAGSFTDLDVAKGNEMGFSGLTHSNVTDFSAVYFSGEDTVSAAYAAASQNADKFCGFLKRASASAGTIIGHGPAWALCASDAVFVVGQKVYLSSTAAGKVVAAAPTADTTWACRVGFCMQAKATDSGTTKVRVFVNIGEAIEN